MAEFIVIAQDFLGFKRGELVEYKPDGWGEWGRKDTYLNWVANGFRPADWNERTKLIKLPGLDWRDLDPFFDTGEDRDNTKLFVMDFEQLERRLPSGGRDTLRTERWIERTHTDADVVNVVTTLVDRGA